MELIALKEWAIAVKAMEDGLQDVIFRKGGIQEPTGDFQPEHNEFLLYPAREHQKAHYIKAEFHPMLEQVLAEEHGSQITIHSQATVVDVLKLHNLEQAESFQSRHIWTPEFIQMRLDYKPDRPLYAMILKVNRLPRPISFTETTQQAGCKSWVTVSAKPTSAVAKPTIAF